MRASETTPLQFKYDAADCRIFYTLDNVYNMSRLWRDAATAAFDDPARCVDGSTGFGNSSKPAPQPSIISATPKLDFGAADALLIEQGLDLSGGPQGTTNTVRTTDITPCSSGCGTGSKCETVTLGRCGAPTNQQPYQLCVPYILATTSCPEGTQFKQDTSVSVKGYNNPTKKGSSLSGGGKSIALGSCIPFSNSPKFCV